MARRVTVALEDDRDGGPAEETVRFGFDGIEHEIDLSAKSALAFRNQLAPLVEHARKTGRGPARGPGGRVARRRRRARADNYVRGAALLPAGHPLARRPPTTRRQG